MARNPVAVWEYTLTGFNDFLEQRRVAFTEPMPGSRVCSICGRLPSATIVLPYGDVFCELCLDEVCDEAKCPFDGRAFTERQLVRLRFELSDLEQRRVVCILAGRQCAAFDGQLSELERPHASLPQHGRQVRQVQQTRHARDCPGTLQPMQRRERPARFAFGPSKKSKA
ncbi:hypothetical protein HPB51_011897 [Rhipicephalus microplus]|uniref:RING-type domain-containing protein n=1 Tax=Rhipicephalus microplus TaxID=6941 RepID=A0A9J6E9T5_RHIMP|nr:hypothetical protein HPB51_011897 [Rhipicephalus microplus]